MAVLPGVAEIVYIPVTVSWDCRLCTYGIATACGLAVAWPGAARIVAGVAVIIAPVTVGVAATRGLAVAWPGVARIVAGVAVIVAHVAGSVPSI